MILTKKHLPRRTFLRGAGVTLALPLLDAMVPAATVLAQTAAAPKLRAGFLYVPHGATMDQFTPSTTGAGFDYTTILRPLEAFRRQMVVVSNLDAKVDGGHAVSNTVWLNGIQPKKTEGEDVFAAVTIDQMIADRIGQDTPFPSLEFATEDLTGSVGACDVGYSCAYMNTISWRTPTTPLPMEIDPRVSFERMFGDGSTPAARAARRDDTRSILDSLVQEVARLRNSVGPRDRVRLGEYVDNVREIERRIQKTERQNTTTLTVPENPVGVPDSYDDHVDILFELQKLAFQGDITRVFTFMLGRELSERTYPQAGCADPHHYISHHQNDPAKIAKHTLINTYHASLFAKFMTKLQEVNDGDGSLLDHSLLFYGSGMSNGNGHTHDPLPAVVAGGANGRLRGDRHLLMPEHTPLANLLLAILNVAGVEKETLGPSTGKVDL